MENAAKALLMAGGVLLAILLLSLMAYLFSTMASNANSIYNEMDQSEISKFNQTFLNYEERGETNPLTIQDVITIVNFAKNNNENGNMPIKVEVKVTEDKRTSDWTKYTTATLNAKLSSKIDTKYYCSNIKIDNSTKLVSEVLISEIK